MERSKIPAYIPSQIETKWQKYWEEHHFNQSNINVHKPKHYALTMLPYPSGNLHIGHWYAVTPSDARARFMRMNGYNVLFPMGFDAFGLPAENAAINHNIHPKKWTYANITRMREQFKSMGTIIDWRREAITSDEKYYRWTQWFFIQFYNNGLAYRKLSPVDWCPHCNTTLAREQVWGDDRHCERCGTPVIKKDLEQWFFRITRYADELLDFSGIDWPQPVRLRQINWIDRSEGATVKFKTENGHTLEVFTTRPDTLWGATFMVLAPEHPLVKELTRPEYKDEMDKYIQNVARQTEIQRKSVEKIKTGVFTGSFAINPVNQKKIPIWVADYVTVNYGTGAIMAVPAHDERDFDFAKKFNLDIQVVIQPDGMEPIKNIELTKALPAYGTMINSGEMSGTPSKDAFPKMIDYLVQRGLGGPSVNYGIRDWLISRQRYWGAPIPIIYCPKCGEVPVPEKDLPVVLPEDVEWKPTGESPLKLHPTWRFTKCPKCGEKAERETDTMDTFMCSSWYHLRYLSPDYAQGPFKQDEYDYWMPVDTYTGGAEHATMHLIYTRFFHKACRDLGIVKGNEPMLQLRNQGQILGPDGQRMSKSRGNVIDPDEQVKNYGADTVRAFLMFGYRWADGGPWDPGNIQGVNRWLNRVWITLLEDASFQNLDERIALKLKRKTHQTLKAVTRDFREFEFNTIVSALMELLNYMEDAKRQGAFGSPVWDESVRFYLCMLAPIAPHISEEIWHLLRYEGSVHQQKWPSVDEQAIIEDVITLVVQVNGKVRDRIEVPAGISETEARKIALSSETVQKFLAGKEPQKTIFVPGKLINIVR